jgi:hypothetical protein
MPNRQNWPRPLELAERLTAHLLVFATLAFDARLITESNRPAKPSKMGATGQIMRESVVTELSTTRDLVYV